MAILQDFGLTSGVALAQYDYLRLFRIVKRKQALVSEIVKIRNGQYRIHLSFYHPIDYEFMNEVPLIHNLVFATPLDASREDEVVWGNDDEGNDGYTVSHAYDKLLEPVVQGMEEFPKDCVWKSGIPLKIQFFVWLACLDRIASYDMMRRKGIIWVNHCSMCFSTMETSNHLLIHCGFASMIWTRIMRSFGVTWVQPKSVRDLMTGWQFYEGRNKGKIIWSLIPHAVLWCLWLERNARCFDDNQSVTMKVLLSVRGMIGQWCTILPEFKDYSYESFLFQFDRISNLNL